MLHDKLNFFLITKPFLLFSIFLVEANNIFPQTPISSPTKKEVVVIVEELLEEGTAFASKGDNIKAFELHLQALSYTEYIPEEYELLAQLHNRLSFELGNINAYENAIEEGIKALKYESLLNAPNKNRFLIGHIAGMYLKLNNHDSALAYYKMEKEISIEINGTPAGGALNNIGVFYSHFNEHDSAMYYFKTAKQANQQASNYNTGLNYSITDNIGLICIKEKDYQTALSTFSENLSLANDVEKKYRPLQSHLRLADTYLFLKDLPKAYQHLKLSEREYIKNASHIRKNEFDKLRLDLWVRYHAMQGNPIKVNEYLAKKNELLDSLQNTQKEFFDKANKEIAFAKLERFETELKEQELKIKSQQNELEITELKANKRRDSMVLTIIISLLFILAIAQHFIRKNMVRKKQKQLVETENELIKLKLENEKLESIRLLHKLEHKTKDITQLVMMIAKLQDLYDITMNNLNQIKRSSIEDKDQLLRKTSIDLSSKLQQIRQDKTLQENIQTVNDEFYTVIKELHPNLNKFDLEMCGLIVLNLSNKEIAAMRNVEASSAKKARQRLKKRLDLKENEDIQEYLLSILKA